MVTRVREASRLAFKGAASRLVPKLSRPSDRSLKSPTLSSPAAGLRPPGARKPRRSKGLCGFLYARTRKRFRA
jgi:hypothetical protein